MQLISSNVSLNDTILFAYGASLSIQSSATYSTDVDDDKL